MTGGGYPKLPVLWALLTRYDPYRSGKSEPVFSHHRLEVLIACQIRQIEGLDIFLIKVYPFLNSHRIQSSGELSA